MNRHYHVARLATVREVLEHFVRVEASRAMYAERASEMFGWLAQPDAQFFELLRSFGDSRDDTNPLLTWTVGTRENRHHLLIKRWVLAEVPMDAFYTCGLNPAMRDDLRAARWNLAKFATSASKYPEFRLDSMPETDELTRVVGVVRPSAGCVEEVELVDGAHRLVSMAHHGIRQVTAYLGELLAAASHS
jgi:hypothetical protein